MWKPGRMDEAYFYELPPVRALLFDLGGVVINFDFGRAFQLWASRAGCDPRLIAERFCLDDSYEQHERGEIPGSSYFAALRHSLGIDISDDDFIAGWNDVYLGPVPGMSEVLSVAQRHLPLFAFTNSNPTHKSAWEILYANELRPFQQIFVSPDLGNGRDAKCAGWLDERCSPGTLTNWARSRGLRVGGVVLRQITPKESSKRPTEGQRSATSPFSSRVF